MKIIIFITICCIITFCDQKRIEKYYYKNGKLKYQVEVIDSVFHGESKLYFENGNIKTILHWNNGKKQGIALVYYDNGRLASNKYYEKGKLLGWSWDFFQSGRLMKKAFYYNDSIRSICEFYSDSIPDRLVAEDIFATDHGRPKQVGWIEYNVNGSIKEESRCVKIRANKDTVSLGEELVFNLELKKPKFDSTIFVVESSSDELTSKKSNHSDTIVARSHSIVYSVKGKVKGWNFIKGYVKNLKLVGYESDDTYQTMSIPDIYFEYPYYVK